MLPANLERINSWTYNVVLKYILDLGTDLLMNWFLFRSVLSSWLKKQEQGAGPLTLLLLLH